MIVLDDMCHAHLYRIRQSYTVNDDCRIIINVGINLLDVYLEIGMTHILFSEVGKELAYTLEMYISFRLKNTCKTPLISSFSI